MKDFTKGNFINDFEKMRDFMELDKDEFLECYSYLTEEEYDNTKEIYDRFLKSSFPDDVKEIFITVCCAVSDYSIDPEEDMAESLCKSLEAIGNVIVKRILEC